MRTCTDQEYRQMQRAINRPAGSVDTRFTFGDEARAIAEQLPERHDCCRSSIGSFNGRPAVVFFRFEMWIAVEFFGEPQRAQRAADEFYRYLIATGGGPI